MKNCGHDRRMLLPQSGRTRISRRHGSASRMPRQGCMRHGLGGVSPPAGRRRSARPAQPAQETTNRGVYARRARFRRRPDGRGEHIRRRVVDHPWRAGPHEGSRLRASRQVKSPIGGPRPATAAGVAGDGVGRALHAMTLARIPGKQMPLQVNHARKLMPGRSTVSAPEVGRVPFTAPCRQSRAPRAFPGVGKSRSRARAWQSTSTTRYTSRETPPARPDWVCLRASPRQ